LSASSREVSRVLWGTLLANLLVAIGKLVYGYSSGMLSVIADGYHSLLDASSNIVGLIGFRLSIAPPDDDHHYGHHKFEIFSAMGISLLLFIAAFNILQASFQRWMSPEPLDPHPSGYLILGLTIFVTFFIHRWQKRRAEVLDSAILLADSEHTKADFLGSLGAMIALAAVRHGFPEVDFLVALLIGLVIARSGFRIALQSAGVLADRAPISADSLISIAQEFSSVKHVHSVRSRGFGSGVFVDMSIQLDPELSLDAAHDIVHLVEDQIRSKIPEVHDLVIHAEPYYKPKERRSSERS